MALEHVVLPAVVVPILLSISFISEAHSHRLQRAQVPGVCVQNEAELIRVPITRIVNVLGQYLFVTLPLVGCISNIHLFIEVFIAYAYSAGDDGVAVVVLSNEYLLEAHFVLIQELKEVGLAARLVEESYEVEFEVGIGRTVSRKSRRLLRLVIITVVTRLLLLLIREAAQIIIS